MKLTLKSFRNLNIIINKKHAKCQTKKKLKLCFNVLNGFMAAYIKNIEKYTVVISICGVLVSKNVILQ